MAFTFEERADGLVYVERQPMWVRLFIAAVGTGLLIIPIATLRADVWRSPSVATLVAALWTVLPISFAVLLWNAALRGEQRIELDSRRHVLRDHVRGPFGGLRRSVIGFEHIEAIEVVRREAVDDPPYYQIQLRIAGRRRPLQLGNFAMPAEAEYWQQRLAAEVAA